MDAAKGDLPVDGALAAELAHIDSTEWDRERAAQLAAKACIDAGRPDLAADRLAAVARSQDAAGRFAHSGDTWSVVANLEGIDDTRLDDALVRCARARVAAGDAPAALEALARLYACAEADGDHERLARACYLLQSRTLEAGAASGLLHAGAVLGDDAGWSWQCRAMVASLDGAHESSLRASHEALARARASGDIALEALALEGVAYSLGYLGRLDESRAATLQVVDLFRHDGDLPGVLRSLGNLVTNAIDDLDLRLASRHVEDLAVSLPQGADDRWVMFVEAHRSVVERLRGDLAAALAHASAAVDAIAPGSASTMSEHIAVQSLLDAALEAGALVEARRADRLEEEVARRIGGAQVRHDRAWTRLRLDLAEGGDLDDEWIDAASRLAASSDEWLIGLIASEVALLATWRGKVEAIGPILDAVDTDVVIPFVEVRLQVARALVGLHRDDDVRPLRAVRHTLERAGLVLDVARLDLAAALASGRHDDARIAIARLEHGGALRDVHEVTSTVPDLAAPRPGHPALVSQERRPELVERALDAGAAMALPSGTVLVASGVVRLVDEQGRVVGVAGPGSWVDDAHARADEATELVASVDAALLVAGDVLVDLPRSGEHGVGPHMRCRTDARESVAERIERVLAELVARWGTTGAGGRVFDSGLSQDDLAALGGTSRKSATLAISHLRRAGIADARRGRITLHG